MTAAAPGNQLLKATMATLFILAALLAAPHYYLTPQIDENSKSRQFSLGSRAGAGTSNAEA